MGLLKSRSGVPATGCRPSTSAAPGEPWKDVVVVLYWLRYVCGMVIRDATPADFAAVLSLNAESEHYLSPLTPARLAHLHRQTRYHRVIEIDAQVVAFLLVFGPGADYDSVNYQWFAQRHDCFLYIDRVVVSAARQGGRLGGTLYTDLIAFAQQTSVATITCEFDVVPPNERSRRFHARFGFREVGSQWVAGGKKQVSLQVLNLDA